MTDVWAPWKDVDQDALGRVFDLTDFEAQCRALLDLAPKCSARDLSLLPWDEKHEAREFRIIRDAWVAARRVTREAEKETAERTIEEQVREQFENAVAIKDMKAAYEALAVLVKLGTAKGIKKAAQQEDDFSRLDERETLMLGALVHKLRSEPLTSTDDQMLAYVALIDLGESAPNDPEQRGN